MMSVNDALTPSPNVADSYLNVAFYRFVDLADPFALQSVLRDRASELSLRGSILLSEEGINAFLAGRPAEVRTFLAELAERSEFRELDVKESYSDHVPFKRMIVKVKREIITMGMPGIRPKLVTGQRLAPLTLKTWLDEKKPVVLVDTRNDYEVEGGTFEGAVDYGIETFKEFPDALRARAEELKDKTVVMFCTGGIRCEKATALALDLGIQDVYQLEGGILKYFEDTGGAHYRGDCFVFDGREAVDANLSGAVDRSAREKRSGMELFYVEGDPGSEALRAILALKKLPHALVPENPREPSERLRGHFAKARLPLLVHRAVPFPDAWAAAEYVDELFPDPALMPKEPARRARARTWARWIEALAKDSGSTAGFIGELKYLQGALTRRHYLVDETRGLVDFYVAAFLSEILSARKLTIDGKEFASLKEWFVRMKRE